MLVYTAPITDDLNAVRSVDILVDIKSDIRGCALFLQSAANNGAEVEQEQLLLISGMLSLAADALGQVVEFME